MREFKNRRNPILPLEFHIPDSEAHVMPDGKLYLYGSFGAIFGINLWFSIVWGIIEEINNRRVA